VLLALERSTARGSAALLSEDGARIAAVEDSRGFQGDAYALVDAVLAQANVPLRDVSRYAVGTGPGSFSGIRSAIAVLTGLALPVGGRLVGVSSAAAIHAVFRAEHSGRGAPAACQAPPNPSPVAVVGDARRGRLWIALYGEGAAPTHGASDFSVVPHAAVAESIPSHAMVVTPDLDRLQPLLAAAFPPERVFSVLPTAEAVGRLAVAGSAGDPLPIYLHPAVAKA
jgi:tRNA threonylcarbamoyladenosine biosynthesis protein TsaB